MKAPAMDGRNAQRCRYKAKKTFMSAACLHTAYLSILSRNEVMLGLFPPILLTVPEVRTTDLREERCAGGAVAGVRRLVRYLRAYAPLAPPKSSSSCSSCHSRRCCSASSSESRCSSRRWPLPEVGASLRRALRRPDASPSAPPTRISMYANMVCAELRRTQGMCFSRCAHVACVQRA